jgi:hypothetical protein
MRTETKLYFLYFSLGLLISALLFSIYNAYLFETRSNNDYKYYFIETINNSCVVYNYSNTINNENYTYKTFYTDSRAEFWNVVKQVSNARPYVSRTDSPEEFYNCVNFTNDLYWRLKEKGYAVDMFTTYMPNSNKYHAFNGVYLYIDSVDGEIIKPSQYKDYGIKENIREFDGTDSDYYDAKHIDIESYSVCKEVLYG